MGEFFDKVKDKASGAKDKLLDKLGLLKGDWPQTMTQPPFNVRGFLPPQLIRPTLKLEGSKDKEKEPIYRGLDEDGKGVERREPGGYVYSDWMGYKITDNPEYKSYEPVTTKEKFNLGINIPKDSDTLKKEPYSTRDQYILSNDGTQDYFRHSLQVVDGLATDFPTYYPMKKGEGSTARLYNYLNKNGGTPYENNDPVMFGFELKIDAISSPLLNGAVYDFLDTIGKQTKELQARVEVYEDFKKQFTKLFKTRGTVGIDESLLRMTKLGSNPSTLETSRGIYNPGRRAYMAYYLKKIGGLDNLAEKNGPETKKYLVDYRKDVLKLEFYEDVSLTLGTLAHLYKLLSWSKATGKSMIPDNLLRFNCELVVSECRNFNRTRKAVETGQLEIIKDNVSRYIYNLRECQFHFDAGYSHPGDIEMSGPVVTETYAVTMDYKYVTNTFEKWTPGASNFGKYVSYNNGALWKAGNSGPTRSATYSTAIPRFLTENTNTMFQNGVTKPLVLQNNFKVLGKEDVIPDPQQPKLNQDSTFDIAKDKLKNFGKRSLTKAKDMAKQSANRLIATAVKEGQAFVNTQFALLNDSINKILNASGYEGMAPPRNIYTGESLDLRSRLWYDVRGELLNFVGGFTGNQLAGQTSTGTIVIPPRPPKPNPLAQTNLASQRSFSFTNVSGDTVRYDQSAQQNYGTSDFTKIQFPFYAQRYPPPIT